MSEPILLAVMGPTGSGKSGLAEAIAREWNAQLINADAFQVYRGLDIGTAKPLAKERYRLLDIKAPQENFGVGEWVRMAAAEAEQSFRQGRHCIVVGGTGLYVRALFERYMEMSAPPDPMLRASLIATPIEDLRLQLTTEYPEVASRIDLANPLRVRRALERLLSPQQEETVELPPFRRLKIALDVEREVLSDRITKRVHEMVQNGWSLEVERLRQEGCRREDPGLRAIGYRAIWDYLDQKIALNEAIATTIAETRRYAKRQRTWLRSEPGLLDLSVESGDGAFHQAMERIYFALGQGVFQDG